METTATSPMSTSINLQRQAKQLLESPTSNPADLLQLGKSLLAQEKEAHLRESCCALFEKAQKLFFNKDEMGQAYVCRSLLAQARLFETKHPLHDFENTVLKIVKVNPFSTTPAHFSQIDQGDIKMCVVKGWVQNLGGKKTNRLVFKISYPCRQHLTIEYQKLISYLKECKTAFADLCSDITIEQGREAFYGRTNGAFDASKKLHIGQSNDLAKIHFASLGTLGIGTEPKLGCSYNKVHIETDSDLTPGEFLRRAQTMLTALGFPNILRESQEADEQRKLALFIYHTHFPSKAYSLENDPNIYRMDPEALRKKICGETKEMEDVYQTYNNDPSLVTTQEIYPGLKVPSLQDVPRRVREAGGVGLILGFLNDAKTLADMLQYGCLSVENRYETGVFTEGLSSTWDYATGGGASVFTTLVTKQMIAKQFSVDRFKTKGKGQILVDLDVLAQGDSYGYPDDRYGRNNRFIQGSNAYEKRQTLWDLTKAIDTGLSGSSLELIENEFMIPHRIPPSFIRGVLLSNTDTASKLLTELKSRNLIVSINGQDTIYGKPVTEFCRIGGFFQEVMWKQYT